MGAAQSVEQINKVSLKVMVDQKRDKVLYAEAGKDFVDALFTFLTLPLGTAARLISKESNIEPAQFGSISSLYQGVKDLGEEYLCNKTCKEMLLKPRSSMEAYFRQLKLNIDDTEPMKHFICQNPDCNSGIKEGRNRLSLYRNQKCGCGKVMNRCVEFPTRTENGFAKENATFIISDDLNVMPNVFETVAHLHQKLKVINTESIVEQTVDISKKEVLDILKLSLFSKSPLTDFIFKDKHSVFKKKNQEYNVIEVKSDKVRHMSVKVVRRKSTGEIIFVEAREDFIHLVFSFLTIPLGAVSHMLEGFSYLNCIDNLYKSVTRLESDIYLMSQDIKEKLSKSLIAAQFELSNPILPIGAATLPIYLLKLCPFSTLVTSTTHKHDGYYRESFVPLSFLPLKLVDPKISASKSSSLGEFAKGPSIYMVTDDLVVTPISSFTAITHLNSSKVSLLDVEERVIRIGLKEGLCILKASLSSTSALTNGLKKLIKTTIKEEK